MQSFEDRAAAIAAQAEEIANTPVLSKVAAAEAVLGSITGLLIDMGKAVDAHVPYLDEEGAANDDAQS